MVNLKNRTIILTITLFCLIILSISIGFTAKINTAKKSVETFAIQNNLQIRSIDAVAVRKNELLKVSLNAEEENIVLDTGGAFSRPLISPDKSYVAYLRDKALYVTTCELKHMKVADNVHPLSFSWQDEHNLLYSPSSGGIYVFDTLNKTTKPYLQNEFYYENITLDSKGRIYAEQYRFYKKQGLDYIADYGVIFFDPSTKEWNLVIKSIPSKITDNGDLGMYPIINGISKDDKYLYIFKHPHAGSLAADGVDFAAFDILNNKLIEYTNPNIISLLYKDNISENPKNSRYLALIYGAGREMNNNKQLILLDILTGKFQTLSSKDEAAMTPYYLSDGKTIIYAASPKEKENIQGLGKWISNGEHHIYSIDTTTRERKQLTNDPRYFDFAPKYIDNIIVFFRIDKNSNISMWKLVNGKETMLADGLIFYNDSKFPIQEYYGHFYSELFTDIK